MGSENQELSNRQFIVRGLLLVSLSFFSGLLTWNFVSGGAGASLVGEHLASPIQMALSVGIFVLIIAATLLFWNFRLAIAFIGISILLGGNVLSLRQLILSTELDIIFFLIGMMTMVGVLKDLGLFTWLIQLIINMKNMTGPLFVLVTTLMSAVMASVVDEVTSIVIMLALVFQVCDTLKLNPVPFVMISVIATNIGSSGTMLGNPVGILIGTKAGFSFYDFLKFASPIMFVSLAVALLAVLIYYKKEIKVLTERLDARRNLHLGLGPLVRIPYRRGLIILLSSITLIALHHTLETFLGIEKNTLLIVTPLAISGVLMIWKNKRARHYIESEVEWWTLIFFMMLFAVAGSLEHTGITQEIAMKFKEAFGTNPIVLTPIVLLMGALGSAFVDNIVFVAAFIPVVKQLGSTQLWWALLFGACFGGNITVIGSTANIVALGMMEKRYHKHITFFEWFKIGLIVGIITCLIAWIGITLLSPFMPDLSITNTHSAH